MLRASPGWPYGLPSNHLQHLLGLSSAFTGCTHVRFFRATRSTHASHPWKLREKCPVFRAPNQVRGPRPPTPVISTGLHHLADTGVTPKARCAETARYRFQRRIYPGDHSWSPRDRAARPRPPSPSSSSARSFSCSPPAQCSSRVLKKSTSIPLTGFLLPFPKAKAP